MCAGFVALANGTSSVVDSYSAAGGVDTKVFESAEKLRITALYAGDLERVLFANQRIRTPLAVSGEVAVYQVVAVEALVASGIVLFDDGEGNAGEVVDMHLVRRQTCSDADGVVVSKVHVWQVDL